MANFLQQLGPPKSRSCTAADYRKQLWRMPQTVSES